MRNLCIAILVFAICLSFLTNTYADLEVIDDLAPTTIKFNKEVYSPGETVEFTAETEKQGVYLANSVEVLVDFSKVKLKFTKKTTKDSYIVKGAFTAPKDVGAFSVSYKIRMKDNTGMVWVGYVNKQLNVNVQQAISLSPSKATIKVGEELYLVGKHSYLKEKDVRTGWNVSGDTGYYKLNRNVIPLKEENGYKRELTSFVADKPGEYIIFYGIDFVDSNGVKQYENLSAKVTVELP